MSFIHAYAPRRAYRGAFKALLIGIAIAALTSIGPVPTAASPASLTATGVNI